jgi:hypothetical protein
MNRCRPVAARNTRTAVSAASEPEWPSHTLRGTPPGIVARIASATRTAGSLTPDRMLADAIDDAARWTAATMAGWLCPKLAAPHEAEKSSRRRPRSSIRYEPSPPTTASGKNRSFCSAAIDVASRSTSVALTSPLPPDRSPIAEHYGRSPNRRDCTQPSRCQTGATSTHVSRARRHRAAVGGWTTLQATSIPTERPIPRGQSRRRRARGGGP